MKIGDMVRLDAPFKSELVLLLAMHYEDVPAKVSVLHKGKVFILMRDAVRSGK